MKKLLFSLLFLPYILHSENITVFAHGIVDDASQSQRFQKVITTPQFIAPNFADALTPSGINFNNFLHTLCLHFDKKVNRNAMFMGQKNDISIIQATIDNINPNNKIILYGCSRGAATLVSYLGIHNPKNIAALILDACPANMPETIEMVLAQLGINPAHCNSIFSYIFPQYNPKLAIPPIQALQNIQNKNLPILLLHSLEDKKVHFTNSLKLYQKFIDAGFQNVHICLLPHGKHSFLLQDDRVKDYYTMIVHSFYKKYNLPYDQEIETLDYLPANTANYLNLDRFDLVNVLNNIPDTITKYQQDVLKTYNQSYHKNMSYSAIAITMAIAYWYLKNNYL